jgi:hypothetical protein
MQEIATNQPLFSLSLIAAFIFGLIFAGVVRWASRKKWVAQTAFAVLVGVAGTLLTMIPVFGVQNVAVMFAFFGASGISMIAEYLERVMREIQKDREDAKTLASELLNERQTGRG